MDRALLNERVEEECFYHLNTNVFSLTAADGVVPAEFSFRMSLRKGVEEFYHVFIEPGTERIVQKTQVTHKIPPDLALFIDNYQQIVEDMLRFLMTHQDCRELPLLYCLPKYKRQKHLALAWLLYRVQEDLAVEVRFKH